MPDGTHGIDASVIHREATARLIVALDMPTIEEAQTLVRDLTGVVFAFKVGFHLLVDQNYNGLVQAILDSNSKIFLDLKMYDIPHTIESAVRNAAARGISFITVHHNKQVVEAAARGRGNSSLKIFVVPLLTTFDLENLIDLETGKPVRSAASIIEWNTRRALQYGANGVIAAPTDDLQRLREIAREEQKEFWIATPGVRPEGVSMDDHLRSGSPSAAIKAGADYLIVGRPIYNDPKPRESAARIIAEIATALRDPASIGSPNRPLPISAPVN